MRVKRIERDASGTAAYVYFEEIRAAEAYRQIPLPGGLVFDLARDGRLLGIEILNADLLGGLSDSEVIRTFERARIPVRTVDKLAKGKAI